MSLNEYTGLGLWLVVLLFLLVLPLIALFARRRWLMGKRGGIDVAARLTGRSQFSLGMAHYVNHEFHWYRALSWVMKPKLHLRQGEWEVVSSRMPDSAEAAGIYVNQKIVILRHRKGHTLELAMAPSAMTGFLAWLESAAPGAAHYGNTTE